MSFKTRRLSIKNLAAQNSATLYADAYAGTGIPALSLFNQYKPQRYPYLLLSSAAREHNTQYDILIACPQYVVSLDSNKHLTCKKLGSVDEDIKLCTGFFDTLENLYQNNKEISDITSSLPFTGGWFVYLAYEMAEEIEHRLSLPALPAGQPLAVAARCPAAIIFDKKNNQLIGVAEDKYDYLLDELEQDYINICRQNVCRQGADESKQVADNSDSSTDPIVLASLVEADPEPYLEQVSRIKQYIVDGDIFQANLSRQWRATLRDKIDDAALFNALSKHNPSSFAAMACLDNITIISSSPERLVSLKNGIVETRPIAGTRARDNNQQSDTALARELLAHPKEQAEHIMLIDLERNDLGRVCRPGSIEVNELMVLESWQHVHHIVSNVRGELEKDKSPVDVLRAVFPGGTITGCPKVRCMEILAEMEQEARGAYTGSLGYINKDGSMDFNILIRTMVRNTSGNNNEITFRAGGGIVNDSIAEKELEETRAKAKGLLKIFSL